MDSFKVQYKIDGEDFAAAGEASRKLKKAMQSLGIDPKISRKVAVAMYEGEINMVIHADGGVIDVEITQDKIHRRQRRGIQPLQQAAAPILGDDGCAEQCDKG